MTKLETKKEEHWGWTVVAVIVVIFSFIGFLTFSNKVIEAVWWFSNVERRIEKLESKQSKSSDCINFSYISCP